MHDIHKLETSIGIFHSVKKKEGKRKKKKKILERLDLSIKLPTFSLMQLLNIVKNIFIQCEPFFSFLPACLTWNCVFFFCCYCMCCVSLLFSVLHEVAHYDKFYRNWIIYIFFFPAFIIDLSCEGCIKCFLLSFTRTFHVF